MRLLYSLLLLAFTVVGQAAMVVDRAVITFPANGSARQDVVVTNPDEKPLYIDVQVLQVSQPGTGVEKREVVKDPESIGLIATPRRLMVPAGAQRLVRLVNLNGHGKSERVYRINLKPVSGPVESEQMGVHVMVGYQLLVFIEPQKVNVELSAERDGKELELHNTGNVNVRVHNGKQCPPAPSRDKDCRELNGLRLYPGNNKVVELPWNAPVTFSVSASGDSWKRRFE